MSKPTHFAGVQGEFVMSDGASLVQELRRQIAELQLDNARLWRESQELRCTVAAPLGNDPEAEINDKERLWLETHPRLLPKRETHPSLPPRRKKIRPERAPREKGPINISDDLWMPEPNSGCWLWLGKTHDGRAWFRNLAAARVMWRMLHGAPRGHDSTDNCRERRLFATIFRPFTGSGWGRPGSVSDLYTTRLRQPGSLPRLSKG
jgi:hypothetical protein